jgi:transposase
VGKRKDLIMAERRRFTATFKRQVVEELLSETSTLGQLSRRYDISSGLIVHWKKRYEGGGLIEGLSQSEKALLARNAELERMVGKLTMENELLKRAVQHTVRRRKEASSPITAKSLAVSRGGAK